MRGRVTAILLAAVSATAVLAQQPQQQPTFRTRITVVPVDVRVLDRDGKPITDLKQSDFTITEDGVAQQIVHFSFQSLEPQPAAADDRPAFRKPLGETITPQAHRTFLIVLGRGRQIGPVKGVEAAMKFVKERLLPQDRVAVLGYNRATDFTTDHTRIRETLERYAKRHESIEAKLRHRFSGLAAVYASREIPKNIQAEIDAIFRAPGALTSRSVDAGGIAGEARLDEDRRRERDKIMQAEIAKERQAAGMGTAFDQAIIDEAAMLDSGFDEYVEKSFDTQTDLGNLYAGIRYLRWLDGEKHLVFLTPNGLFLPRVENANSIAAFANDARVSIDVIHTYGMQPAQVMSTVLMPGRGSVTQVRNVPGFGQAFQNADSRGMAQLTGGQMMANRAGDAFFKRLDDTTRAQYLLGYSPSNDKWDGRYRRIDVKVNRKGAQVLFRHGYAARRETTPLDRQQYLTYSRIASAANVARSIDDIPVTLGTPSYEGTPLAPVMSVQLSMRPGAIRLKREDGNYVGKVEVVAFAADDKQALIGELWQTLDFKLTEENYQKFQREGASYTMKIALKGAPRYLKAIVYDYTADLIGSSLVDLKKK